MTMREVATLQIDTSILAAAEKSRANNLDLSVYVENLLAAEAVIEKADESVWTFGHWPDAFRPPHGFGTIRLLKNHQGTKAAECATGIIPSCHRLSAG